MENPKGLDETHLVSRDFIYSVHKVNVQCTKLAFDDFFPVAISRARFQLRFDMTLLIINLEYL